MTFVGSQRHPTIACIAREPEAGRQHPPPQPLAPAFRFQKKQAELRSIVRQADTEDRAKPRPAAFRHEPPFAQAIMRGPPPVEDRADKRAEAFVETGLGRIERRVALHDPVQIVRAH